MAEKRYKLTAAVIASPNYVQNSAYKFRVGFYVESIQTYCNPKQCPVVTCTSADVIGTTNDWAQQCIEKSKVSGGLSVDGQNFTGIPNSEIWELTTDPVTINLDNIFPSP